MVEVEQSIVCDFGSDLCKVGFSGEENPRDVFQSIVGRPKNVKDAKEYFVGDDAQSKRDMLTLKYPIKYGFGSEWNDIECLWEYTFEKSLQVDPSDYPMLLTEMPNCPRCTRERAVQMMFEKYDVPALCLKIQAVLSLLSSGRTTGLVLDSGAWATYSIPIYEGYALPNGTMKLLFGGDDITYCFGLMLSPKGININENRSIYHTIKKMKEKFCYIAINLEEELNKCESLFEIDYELPDGSKITIGDERFKAAEGVFQPSILHVESMGVHELINFSIARCDRDIRKELYRNISFNGGSTLFPGFGHRLRKELQLLTKGEYDIEVRTPGKGLYSAWVGGSLLSSLSTFKAICMSKEEYDEYGPTLSHIRFF
ncbi:DgyrCDS11308 [Dimorphilus gyrociliatus]|uniref:DgyrCDS11308 n=1 Tax=Dimorphilus gyrociliatus TaxID=2664684 RepID=A0A7I8W3Y3_9ANNE|nr:DgyrCDS11308 [Dimorphilus gyrociliatus]